MEDKPLTEQKQYLNLEVFCSKYNLDFTKARTHVKEFEKRNKKSVSVKKRTSRHAPIEISCYEKPLLVYLVKKRCRTSPTTINQDFLAKLRESYSQTRETDDEDPDGLDEIAMEAAEKDNERENQE